MTLYIIHYILFTICVCLCAKVCVYVCSHHPPIVNRRTEEWAYTDLAYSLEAIFRLDV